MTDSTLDCDCPNCGFPYPDLEATSAAHDDQLIDIIVRCPDCGWSLNAFVALSEMTVLNPGQQQGTQDGSDS